MVAVIPIANLAAANATLEELAHGPNNFSVAAYTGPAVTHGAFHSWNDPVFEADVQAIEGVIWEISEGNHEARVKALIEAQGAQSGDQAPDLPSAGNVTAGKLYRHEGNLWSVIQSFSRTTYGADPVTYPALIRRVRNPHAVEPWKQPIDQYDSYNLANPFTGAADRCTFGGKTYATKINANVWSPTGYPAGWELVE